MLAHYYRYNNIDNKLNLLSHHEINYQNNRIKYTYDKYGQITEKVIINENNQQIEKYTYTYNSKNMLTNEYYEDDLDNGYTIHYTYDDAGNVVSVTKKDLNNVTIEHKSFAYSNNKLTTFTKNGLVKTFGYNTNDELASYGDNSLIWNEGKLSSFGNLSFEYDSNGRRTRKRIGNDQNVEYLYDDNKIIRSIKNDQKVDYLYDINEKLIGLKLLDNNYFYEREITGIITDIVDESGNSVVKYKYDGFGNLLSASGDNTIIDNNIFLYKGYCYDVETQLFYCNSRYYSPELCRWISPDSIEYLDPESINGLNLYAYCGNDPINRFDPTGHDWEWSTFWKGLFMVGTAISAIAVSVATFGLATPLAMTIVAGVTLGAGVLTGINGVATMIEAGTDYNFVRDGLFNEVLGFSDTAYDWYAGITEGVAIVGTAICTIWNITNPIKGFTDHGRQSALTHDGHGVNARAMQNAVRNPLDVVKQTNGGIKHVGKNAVVVLNKAGKVITTYAKSHYGWRMMLALWLGSELF